jgi:hypothetical protein
MSSRIICVRVPKPLHAALIAFCAAHGHPPSVVMRGALRDLLAHPERWPDIYAREDGLQTPWEPPGEAEAFDGAAWLEQSRGDMAELVAQMARPGA